MAQAGCIDGVDRRCCLGQPADVGDGFGPARQHGHEDDGHAVADYRAIHVGGDNLRRPQPRAAGEPQGVYLPLGHDGFVLEDPAPDVSPQDQAMPVGQNHGVHCGGRRSRETTDPHDCAGFPCNPVADLGGHGGAA